MKVKTTVAYRALLSEFYNLPGKYLDGLSGHQVTYYHDYPQTGWPDIAGPFKRKSLLDRLRRK